MAGDSVRFSNRLFRSARLYYTPCIMKHDKLLKEASRILKGVHGIRFVSFTEKDVARHHLVQEIISAYERDENQPGIRDTQEKN